MLVAGTAGTTDDLLVIRPGTNFRGILIESHTFRWTECVLKMLSAKCLSFRLNHYVFIQTVTNGLPGQRTSKNIIDFLLHDDVIKWKHFPRYWPFVRGIHRSPVNSLHQGQWRGALMFSLICAWIYNREAGDLRRRRVHCDATVMYFAPTWQKQLVDEQCVPFHNDTPLNGEHPEQRELAHTLWQPTDGCRAIFHKYFCYAKHEDIMINLTLRNLWGHIPRICQNTTMQVYGAWIKRYCILCSKAYCT